MTWNFFISSITMVLVILMVLIAVILNGCSSKVVEPWHCECECETTKFKCNGQTMHIDIKDIK